MNSEKKLLKLKHKDFPTLNSTQTNDDKQILTKSVFSKFEKNNKIKEIKIPTQITSNIPITGLQKKVIGVEDENNFMFLDPPYDSEFTDYGYCQFGKKEQEKLALLFKNTKIKCLMIIGKTKFIEELYNGYIVDEYEKKYRFNLYANRIGDEINTKHLIIKNY